MCLRLSVLVSASVSLSVCLSVCLFVCVVEGLDGKVMTSLTTSGQVKSLGVPGDDLRDLTVSVTDALGSPCRHASLTTLLDGQLGTSNVIFMPPPSLSLQFCVM